MRPSTQHARIHSRMTTPIRNLILDMDGVLWRGETPMPGLADFFATLRRLGIGFVLATNNATKTAVMYTAKLARFGAESLAMRAGADGPVPSDRAEALDRLIERYRRAWLTTSRPGGLDRSEAHLERTRDALRSRPGTA